jgi:hypothetical protein
MSWAKACFDVGDEEVELTFLGPDIGDVDVEIANRVILDGFLRSCCRRPPARARHSQARAARSVVVKARWCTPADSAWPWTTSDLHVIAWAPKRIRDRVVEALRKHPFMARVGTSSLVGTVPTGT